MLTRTVTLSRVRISCPGTSTVCKRSSSTSTRGKPAAFQNAYVPGARSRTKSAVEVQQSSLPSSITAAVACDSRPRRRIAGNENGRNLRILAGVDQVIRDLDRALPEQHALSGPDDAGYLVIEVHDRYFRIPCLHRREIP